MGVDLFAFKGSSYLLLIDYHSRYVEMSKLHSTTSAAVIQHMKSIYARHGIPEILVSDNGPQFSAEIFTQFAQNFDFQHQTSSPNFPQGNGEIERAVKTVKSMLEKAIDPYIGLLSYRTTPLANGYSPVELLMNRKLRSTVPMITKQYIPKVPCRSQLQYKEQLYREEQKRRFNTRHRTCELPPLQQGDAVCIPEFQRNATVLSQVAPRSYTVQTPTGRVRRNRRDLILLPETTPTVNPPTVNSPTVNSPTVNSPLDVDINVSPENSTPSPTTPESLTVPGATVTRSGRISRPPDRLNL